MRKYFNFVRSKESFQNGAKFLKNTLVNEKNRAFVSSSGLKDEELTHKPVTQEQNYRKNCARFVRGQQQSFLFAVKRYITQFAAVPLPSSSCKVAFPFRVTVSTRLDLPFLVSRDGCIMGTIL